VLIITEAIRYHTKTVAQENSCYRKTAAATLTSRMYQSSGQLLAADVG